MNQKDEEILVLNYFRKFLNDFPKGRVIKSESPDFIIKTGRHYQTGIELTRLHFAKNNLFKALEESILRKQEKFKRYQHIRFNSLWLIIYAEDIAGHYLGNIQNKILGWEFHSDFSRLYLFDLFSHNIFRIDQSHL